MIRSLVTDFIFEILQHYLSRFFQDFREYIKQNFSDHTNNRK